jgi:hypothetical protein
LIEFLHKGIYLGSTKQGYSYWNRVMENRSMTSDDEIWLLKLAYYIGVIKLPYRDETIGQEDKQRGRSKDSYRKVKLAGGNYD